jgi:arginyl-tRNA--protein-N-Asp/Glu arginylyltransferase
MKLLFSEAKTDYRHYIFPYAVWAFPETGETPADLFNHGFLPSSHNLDRFYLCRHLRVDLHRFRLSSENRRILRKGEGIVATLVPRAEFDFLPARREFFKRYADLKFGKDVMSSDRLDSLFSSKITSHVLLFTDTCNGTEVGVVTLCLDSSMAYYYYAFYDLFYSSRNLGMFMMTTAVTLFAERGFQFLYLGSCYLENSLYKTQFAGVEFFNGVRWSSNLDEVKFLIHRDQTELRQHLLETDEYRRAFYGTELSQIAPGSPFRVEIRLRPPACPS